MVNIRFHILAFLFFICYSNNIFAAKNLPRKQQLQQGVEKILASLDYNVNAGIEIQSMDNGEILYQKNATRFFVPASTLKLFTAATALIYLKPDYKFATKILAARKSIKGGTIKSNVYFKFTGDPSLQRQNLMQLVAGLAHNGVKTIDGNVYIDDSVYDQKKYGPGWMWDELNLCYASPTHAIIVDSNCFWFKLIAANRVGRLARAVNYKKNSFTPVTSLVVTKGDKIGRCYLDLFVDSKNKYRVTGCMKLKSSPISLNAAVNNIRFYAENILQSLLRQYHIKVKGKIGFAKAGTKNFTLINHNSEPLKQLIQKMLKDSDNTIADSLFKKMAFYYAGKSGTWSNGAKAIKNILIQKAHLDLKYANFSDGSGLSRYDSVSPRQIMQLLFFIYHSRNQKSIFLDSLPVAGTDGSLQYRMTKANVKGKVWAKTGTMFGVSSLAGYIDTVNHKKLGFVIIFNGFPDSYKKYEKLEDRLCAFLAQY